MHRNSQNKRFPSQLGKQKRRKKCSYFSLMRFLGIAVAACTLILNLALHSRGRSSGKDATNKRRDHHAPPIFPEAQIQQDERKQQEEEKSAVGTQKWLGLQEKFLMEPRIELIQTRSQSDIADNSAAGPRQGKPRGGPAAAGRPFRVPLLPAGAGGLQPGPRGLLPLLRGPAAEEPVRGAGERPADGLGRRRGLSQKC